MSLINKLVITASALTFASTVLAEDTLAKVNASGAITISYRESAVPFSYLAGGTPIGFTVDLSNKIVEEIKKVLNRPDIKVQLMSVTSQNRITLVKNGTVDLECGATANKVARQADVSFAVSHFYAATQVLTKKSANIKSYSDLQGKTVVATTGTSNVLTMRKLNTEKNLNLDLILSKDHTDGLLLVETDRAAAFANDDVILYGVKATAKNSDDFEVVGEPLNSDAYACMFRKDDPKFKKLVDGVIINLMDSGEFEKMYVKWFSQPIPPYGKALNIPMSKELKENLKTHSDKALS